MHGRTRTFKNSESLNSLDNPTDHSPRSSQVAVPMLAHTPDPQSVVRPHFCGHNTWTSLSSPLYVYTLHMCRAYSESSPLIIDGDPGRPPSSSASALAAAPETPKYTYDIQRLAHLTDRPRPYTANMNSHRRAIAVELHRLHTVIR